MLILGEMGLDGNEGIGLCIFWSVFAWRFGGQLYSVLGERGGGGWGGDGIGLSTFDALVYTLTLRTQKLTMGN